MPIRMSLPIIITINHIGIISKMESATKDDTINNLSATGSRYAPSLVLKSHVRAINPSKASDIPATIKTPSAYRFWPLRSSMIKSGIKSILIVVIRLGRFFN